jgi:hypothetical protein
LSCAEAGDKQAKAASARTSVANVDRITGSVMGV